MLVCFYSCLCVSECAHTHELESRCVHVLYACTHVCECMYTIQACECEHVWEYICVYLYKCEYRRMPICACMCAQVCDYK